MLAQGRRSVQARRGARELLVQALYQWQLADHSEMELCEQFAGRPEFARVDQDYFRELLAAVLRDAESLDRQIGERADRGVEQMDAVSRAVLLLALAELHRRPDIPTKVIINEAVELAKRYGPADGFRFVNAVLDRTAKGMDGRGE